MIFSKIFKLKPSQKRIEKATDHSKFVQSQRIATERAQQILMRIDQKNRSK